MNLFELEAKISLDTSAYDRAVKDAAGKADGVESAFRDVGNASKKAESQTNALSNRLKVVSGLYEEAENRVSELAEALDKSIRETGETSDETRQLASELSKAEKEADSLKSEMDDLADRMEDAGDSSDDLGQTMANAMVKADLFSKGLSLLGEAAMSLASYIWNLDDATEEYRVSQTKLNAAFSTAGFTAGTAKSAFSDLYRAVGDIDRATEASQLLARLARNTEDVATWTEIATGVVGTFGDALPIETLIESANETARTGQVVGTLADALNWAGEIGEDEFNAMLASCATQEERVQLITETLSATYRDAASAYEETSEAVMRARDAHLRLEESMSGLGEAVADLKTAVGQDYASTASGLAKTAEMVVSWLADVVESSGSAKDKYADFISEMETKINTGSIEEALDAVIALQEEAGRLTQDGAYKIQVHSDLGLFGEIDYMSRVNDLFYEGYERIENFNAGLEDTGATAAEAAAEMDIVTVSANGMTLQLENTGLTADEASARLQTYTDAATNMFQQISTESEISYQDAVANLEANIQATEDFANNLTEIAGVLPSQLSEMFAAGGPSVYAGVVSMLAEANRGTDEGLTQINELWRLGGETAVNAFLTSLGMVPEESENPATVVAAQMEQDTSMEIAAEGVVDRTYTALASAVEAAGFDKAGQTAMDKFIAGMESKRSAVESTAQSIANSAKDKINSALSGIASGSYGRYSAGGLDYVPYNGYPAILHAGEAVLTASEAKEWRSGRTAQTGGGVVINQYITAVPQTPAEMAAAAQAYFEQARWAV